MTDIFPAEGETVSDVFNRLHHKGFAPDQDFWVEFSWDGRPYVKTTPETYEKWGAELGGDKDADRAAADDSGGTDSGTADGSGRAEDQGDKTGDAESTQDKADEKSGTDKGRSTASKRR